jgi:hypothetical protein
LRDPGREAAIVGVVDERARTGTTERDVDAGEEPAGRGCVLA